MISCPRCGTENAATARFCSACGSALADQAPAEARKTVTVMFLDVAGSTAIGEVTDPESLRRAMMRYFGEIRTVIERHGGSVEKFIGDAVMAVFGVPAVHEDDALRAVRAAVEIRDRLAALAADVRRERGIAIEWRTGINTGEVVAGDAGTGQHFVTGDAVNVAARLEQAAQPGEILLGGRTYELVSDAAETEQVSAITAKGKAEPVTAYRLLNVDPEAAGRARRLEAPMIGRQRPRRLLADAYEQAVSEKVCHLFTILGSAGVGKSRLLREFLAEVGREALVLRGRCLSYGDGVTYWPIAEVVRQAAALAESDDDAEVRRKIGMLIEDERDRAQATQRLGELLGRFEGAAGQEETFWAIRTLLESIARHTPVVLVLDDLHWAGPTLLDLIDHLTELIRDAPVLLVCLARQELLESRPGWGGGKPYATTLTLEPLSETESRDLVVSLLGQVDLGAALAERIMAAAEGNPLFVEELVGMLIDTGQLVRRDGTWAAAGLADFAVPPTIQALLAARLDGLPAAERAVLERASIEGKVFHRGAVAELAPAGLRDSVPDQLRALARKELVRPERVSPERAEIAGDEAYRFRHLLIRDASYGSIPKELRADLHARFAAWLSRTAADRVAEYDEILGYHYEQAFRYRTELGPPDDEARRLGRLAAGHLRAAGQRALDRGDVTAARKLLESAVELMPADDPAFIRLRADAGVAVSKSGDLRTADQLLAETVELARAAGDEAGAAYAEVMRLDTIGSLGGGPTVEQIIERSQQLLAVLDRHGETRGADMATVELARHQFFAGRAGLAEEILSARIARYEPGGAAPTLAYWLPGALLWGPTPVADAVRRLGEMLASPSSRSMEVNILCSLGVARAMIGEFDAGRELARRGIAIREELGEPINALAEIGNFLGLLEILAENYDEAERVLKSAYEGLSEAGERAYASTIVGLLADVCARRGRYEETERYARMAQEMAQPDDVDAQSRALRAVALVRAGSGDFEAAERGARQAVEMLAATDYLELRGETYIDLAAVLDAAGKRAEAAAAFQRALENFEAKGATVQADRVRRRLAELAANSGQSRG